MPDKFDPYREALVVEADTCWPDAFSGWAAPKRADLERRLHESPEDAADLAYIRTHTGFCRVITVTDADVERLG